MHGIAIFSRSIPVLVSTSKILPFPSLGGFAEGPRLTIADGPIVVANLIAMP